MERIEFVQPGEEKALDQLKCGFPVPGGSLQERWRGAFDKGMW